MYRESYSTARGILGFLIFVGWVSVGIGAVLCLVGLTNSGADRYAVSTAAALFAVTPGIVLVVGGLTQVALAQVGYAVLDQADISRATLGIMHKLAVRVGIEPEEAAEPSKSDGEGARVAGTEQRDSLGFNAAGERIYRGQMIQRVDGRFYVGHRRFTTLGQAKRFIDAQS